MNQETLDKLTEVALSIEKLRQLDKNELQWIKPMLHKTIRNVLDILDLISEDWMSFDDIGIALNIHPQTVSKKINALVLGGMAIDASKTGAIAKTGRPFKLLGRIEK